MNETNLTRAPSAILVSQLHFDGRAREESEGESWLRKIGDGRWSRNLQVIWERSKHHHQFDLIETFLDNWSPGAPSSKVFSFGFFDLSFPSLFSHPAAATSSSSRRGTLSASSSSTRLTLISMMRDPGDVRRSSSLHLEWGMDLGWHFETFASHQALSQSRSRMIPHTNVVLCLDQPVISL